MEFVVAIVALVIGGQLISNWIRAKHGYPVENEWGGTTALSDDPKASRKVELLSNENADLKGKILRLEERVAVLERIATDRSVSLSDEIEALRTRT
jgi:hypothetical protein